MKTQGRTRVPHARSRSDNFEEDRNINDINIIDDAINNPFLTSVTNGTKSPHRLCSDEDEEKQVRL